MDCHDLMQRKKKNNVSCVDCMCFCHDNNSKAFYFIDFFFSQLGGTYAKAVIMPPEVAIGAIGRIQVFMFSLLRHLTFDQM